MGQTAPAVSRVEAAIVEIRGKRAALANRTHDALVRKHARVSASICEKAERSCANETITQGEPGGATVLASDPGITALKGPREKSVKVCNQHLERCSKRTNTWGYLCRKKSHKERAKKEWRSLAQSFSESADKEKRVTACRENEAACKNSVKDCSTKCKEKHSKERNEKERSSKNEQYHKDEKRKKTEATRKHEKKKKENSKVEKGWKKEAMSKESFRKEDNQKGEVVDKKDYIATEKARVQQKETFNKGEATDKIEMTGKVKELSLKKEDKFKKEVLHKKEKRDKMKEAMDKETHHKQEEAQK